MLKRLLKTISIATTWIKKNWPLQWAKQNEPEPEERVGGIFSTNRPLFGKGLTRIKTMAKVFQRTAADIQIVQNPYPTFAMDGTLQPAAPQIVYGAVAFDSWDGSSANDLNAVKRGDFGLSDIQFDWYSAQSFIGYQTMAVIAQQWLIDKACTMPADDAIRQGYEVTVNDGVEVAADVLDALRETDEKYGVNAHLVEFVRKNRIFGIRIAMFKVDSSDPDYYVKPFNIDGVKAGTYKGIVQIDPYWMAPELDFASASDPTSLHFYEPTWWRMPGGLRVHRTHLVKITTGAVPDVLKPTYFYGGVSIPQKIYERVYAAERTANEAPLLVLTKRMDILQIDLDAALTDQKAFQQRMEELNAYRDNYGIRFIGKEDVYTREDTALADVDIVTMTQFQLVASIANVPASKLLCTSPKGFNATGEFEEASYHEELEKIQSNDMTPLLRRHYALVIKSEIAPQFSIVPFNFAIDWGTLDTMTAEEEATVNKTKEETDKGYIEAGVLSSFDVRKKIITDPNSGYNGLELGEEPTEEDRDDEDDAVNDETSDVEELDAAA